ncbi:WXG100 family type VII secretion target [Microterricola viridarii]|uniref:ESAT-6-like protein n=1 Tax=Microterricola viridarii TaxID=412690 RepID=A0A1H1YK93_9MICO|nr:WXG100 family type VII secretion target [Microterricola viridarii]SDT21755.1 WXG100 family type VII secretion target [Microterricola viridarii]
MSQFSVDSEQIIATSNVVQAGIERLRAEAHSLTAQVTNLQGAWAGQASSAFQAAAGDWRTMNLQVDATLAALAQSLGSAGAHYAEIEQANARLFLR